MTAFLTPREMFQEYIEEQNYNYIKMTEFYETEMESYQNEAIKRIKKDMVFDFATHAYAYCLALAYHDEAKCAEVIFRNHNLKDIHAYALLGSKDLFMNEYERLNERSDIDYEE